MANYSKPVAVLVSVDGTEKEDFIKMLPSPRMEQYSYYTGKGGGETLLDEDQLKSLLSRGYKIS